MTDTNVSDLPATTAAKPEASTTVMYETKVHGRDETGLTILGKNGRADFYPDEPQRPRVEEFAPPHSNLAPSGETSDIFSLYPHWGDASVIAGKSIRSVRSALDVLLEHSGSQCASDMESVNALLLVEAHLFEAAEAAFDNRPLELLLHFCAWAVVNAQQTPTERSAWNGLAANLKECCEHPFMATERAYAMIQRLSQMGWNGESEASMAFAAALELSDDAGEPRV